MAPGAILGFWGRRPTCRVEVRATSPFVSILFGASDPGTSDAAEGPTGVPEYARDLHVDDVVEWVLTGRDADDLAPLYYTPLRTADQIAYRHEVFHDLEAEANLAFVRAFGERMQTMRERLAGAEASHYHYERERWLLDAAAAYVAAVDGLSDALAGAELESRGLQAFREHVTQYARSVPLQELRSDIDRVRTGLDAIRYRLRILGGKIVVSHDDGEPDYGAEVLRTFEKFRQDADTEYRFGFREWPQLNHVEAAVLERVALLHPQPFGALDTFCARYADHIDPAIARFEREIQFYVAYLEHIDELRADGLPFCYPAITDRARPLTGRNVFDLALAAGRPGERRRIVTNDFELRQGERVLVVSGPNNGGKTTFARTIGQLHHLARLGCLVPAREARLPIVDRIFTHFERVESVEDLSSKLEDDLRRIHRILGAATSASLLIMNESFSSTTVDDQLYIGRRVMQQVLDCGLLCVVVTFLDELAALDPATVSMVTSVDPDDPARRTFKIERRPADGLAYAMAVAEKHGLTYRRVKSRLAE